MKKNNLEKISPEDFVKARDKIKIVANDEVYPMLSYRSEETMNYNSNKLNTFTIKKKKEIKND
jgi:hypothetical protein